MLCSVLRNVLHAALPYSYSSAGGKAVHDDESSGGSGGSDSDDGDESEDDDESDDDESDDDESDDDESDVSSDGDGGGAAESVSRRYWTRARKEVVQMMPTGWLLRVGSTRRAPFWTFLQNVHMLALQQRQEYDPPIPPE